jgi:hypothetical protein
VRQSLRASLALVALVAAACGEQPPDFYVHDTAVVVHTSAAFASQPEFPSRIESTISAALAYWGGDWSALRGRTVALSGDAYVSCGANKSALGCYDESGNIQFTTSDPGLGTFHCVEQTVLVHEIGHAVIGDPLHEDPRWMQLEPVQAALSGRVGYTAQGEADCTIFVNVWRHLLGTP